MSHCYECLPGLPVWPISMPYFCPQSTILVHPVPPFGPASSPASNGINIATSMNQAPRVFLDYIIQAYSPTTAFHTISYVSPNSTNGTCPNDNTAIYYATGNVERVSPSTVGTGNVVYSIANGCYDTIGLASTPLIGTYCWADFIDGLNLVNDWFGWPLDFTYTMNWQEMRDNMSHYAPGERVNVQTVHCACEQGPCYCQACTDNFGGTGYPGINCIYSSVDLQLCINSAAAEPCCRKPKHLKKANFNACREVLGRHILNDGGAPIKTNNVKYDSSLGNYSFGDCVLDPKDGQYKCCTFDGHSDLIYDKTIACRIINGKFTNDYGIWRSCEEQPMLWDCVSNINSCDEFKNTSEGYVGSFISMSQVDDYYEKLEPTENINKTHFYLSLSPVDLSLSKESSGWCTSTRNKYTYTPKYRITVTTRGTGKIVGGPDKGLGCCTALNCPDKGKGCKCKRHTVVDSGIVTCQCEGSCGNDNKHSLSIEAESFNGLISEITQRYAGITINNTMKFSKIKSVVTEYINSPSCTVAIGILPEPIKDYMVNCSCKQTMSGKYKTESECLANKIDVKDETKSAPTGFHYMSDGTLMSDAEHETLYGSSSSSSESSGYL